jgi:NadR type nicotinamide-nucleotide adenylyltransferase
MLRRVAVTGPESTGKSKLAAWLANAYQTLWVPEYAREYLEKYGPDYTLADVEKIARGQLERENRMAEKATRVLFCDTDLLVTKIWCEEVFGACSAWIDEQFRKHRYDLYLLCSPDIAWEPDPLRENPDDRDRLFALYRQTLEENKLSYRIVTGTGEARFENARTFVEEMLNL